MQKYHPFAVQLEHLFFSNYIKLDDIFYINIDGLKFYFNVVLSSNGLIIIRFNEIIFTKLSLLYSYLCHFYEIGSENNRKISDNSLYIKIYLFSNGILKNLKYIFKKFISEEIMDIGIHTYSNNKIEYNPKVTKKNKIIEKLKFLRIISNDCNTNTLLIIPTPIGKLD